MSDARLRELERKAASGDPVAKVHLLNARLRIAPEFRFRVIQAAYLGDAASREIITQKPSGAGYSNYSWEAWDDSGFNHWVAGLMGISALDIHAASIFERFDHPFLVRCATVSAGVAHDMTCQVSYCPALGCVPNDSIKIAEAWLECPCDRHAPHPDITVSENDWTQAWWDRLGALISGRVAQTRWILEQASNAIHTRKPIKDALREKVVPWLMA